MKTFRFDFPFSKIEKDRRYGKRGWTAILVTDLLDLEKHYKRKNLALKINRAPFIAYWGGPKGNVLGDGLFTTSIIQNVYALVDLAPRVYDMVRLSFTDGGHYGQVVELLPNAEANQGLIPPAKREAMELIAKEKGFTPGGMDHNKSNYLDGKWVDFGKFGFNDEVFKKYLANFISKEGRWSEKIYHDIPKLGITGLRNHKERVKQLCLDEIDFVGKTVLDIGCNLGQMCREYNDRGAARVVGLDVAGIPNVAANIDFYTGYFNNDYYNDVNLSHAKSRVEVLERKTGVKKYDILSFLAVCGHVPFKEDLSKIADTVIFEGHAATKSAEIETLLKPHYKKVKRISGTTDRGNRDVYLGTNL